MMQNNATPGETQGQPQPQPTPQQMYVQAAANLDENHDTIDRFVDWVLFGS